MDVLNSGLLSSVLLYISIVWTELSKLLQVSLSLSVSIWVVSTVTVGQSFCPFCWWLMSLLLFPRFSVCLVPSEPALMSALPGACHIRRGNNPWNDCSLFLTLLLSIPVSPLFPHSPPLTFPRSAPLHTPLSRWAANITMMAFALHVHIHTHTHTHTHTQTLMSWAIIPVWLDLCVCAGKHLIWRTDEVCVPNSTRGRLKKREEHVQFH